MSIIGQVAGSLQSALGAALDAIGRRTGVIRRQRKFSGASLFKTMVLTVLKSPNATTDDFVATAAQLGVPVTAQAIEKRFTEALIGFLRAGLGHVLEHVIAADPVAIPLLERFPAVEIGDSTTVTVPDDYAAEFPGCGGKADSGQAAVKIQACWELRTGKLTTLLVEPGRGSDAQSAAVASPAVPGSLVIRDLGYFSLRRFQERGAAGAYWLSRWQQGTTVLDRDGRPLELLEYVRQHAGAGLLEVPILLGSAAEGVREGPEARPRAQPGALGLVRLDAAGDQLPGGVVDVEGGRRPVPRPLADRTAVQAVEVAQPPGRVAGDLVGGGADGGVLGEAHRRGRATLVAPDVDLVQPAS
jgi:hypothetical protein